MLHSESISTPTLELLIKLQKLPVLSGFRLAGGTSLALQTGHRKSIDLDLFGQLKSDELEVRNSLMKLGSFRLLNKTQNIFVYLINEVKVDVVNYPYQWIDLPVIEDHLILAGQKDIAAMKLAAISGRGTKKDFIDLFFLLKTYSLEEMLRFYQQKYPEGSEFIVLKSLSYFEEADSDVSPTMLIPVEWEFVKRKISDTLEAFINRDQGKGKKE